MKSTADRSVSDPLDQNHAVVRYDDPTHDVPSMLAGRIGDLYASEERLHRKERTDRLMRRAALFTQD